MNNLSFEHFFQMKEMAVYNFGKNKGKHVNDVDRGYATWLLKSIEDSGKLLGSVAADDGSGNLSKDQVIQALRLRSRDQKVAPTSVKKPIQPASGTSVGAVDQSKAPSKEPAQKAAIDPSKYQIPAEKISEYQKSIEDAFSSSNKHLVINALAGTGKTTILKHLAAKFSGGKKWLYLVFNRKNADEANSGEKSFPPNVEAMTSHSFLNRVLNDTRRERPGLLPPSGGQGSFNKEGEEEVKFGNKLNKILDHKWFYDLVFKLEQSLPGDKRGHLIKWQHARKREEVVFALKKKVEKIVGLAKNFAVDPRGKDAIDKIKDIMHQYAMTGELYDPKDEDTDQEAPNFKEEMAYLSLEILKATMPKGSIGDSSIDLSQDFDDWIWWPTLHPDEVVWPTGARYEVALVDEVQDFNNAQKIMLSNLAKNGIRIIVVGDPHQAIYRFRGADAKGFSNIEALLAGTARGSTTHELPVNYRSGKKIIDFVNKSTHVKNLKAGRDHEGSVNPDAAEEEVLSQVEDEFSKDGALKEETAFISRNNAPLFGIALRMLKKGIPFQIIGSDFSGAILDFIWRVVGNDKVGKGRLDAKNVSLDSFLIMMNNYVEEKNHKYHNKKDKEKYLEELEKMHMAMEGMVSHIRDSQDQGFGPEGANLAAGSNISQIRTAEQLCNHIKELFKGIDPADDKRDAAKYDKIDKKRTVMLTTAHRSKGLEFERVNIIHDDLFPDGKDFNPHDEEGVQEHNAKYVAYTRATHTLNLTKSPEGASRKKR